MFMKRPRRNVLAAALCMGVGLILPTVAQGAEAILFDGNNCSGQYRMIDRSVSDFNQIGFDNEVNSLMVITGTFQFYRDAGYGEGNGPSFQLGPSGYQETCWSLNDASQGSFPNDRMSAAQLVADGGQPQPDGVAILYDLTNFGGQYRILTRAVNDFNAIGFDNDVESIRVVSGTWAFFRDAGYGTGNGPAIILGPGDYPNVENVPGYQPGTFPGDRMSAAQVEIGNQPPPPPPPLQCGAGEIAGESQCIPCAQFDAVPNNAGNACVCGPGYEVTQTGILDGITVEFCQQAQTPPPPQQPACEGPYRILTGDGRCVWSCGSGTQPDNASQQCVCQPGLTQSGVDQFGRRVCSAPSQPPVQDVRHTVPAAQLIPAAQAAGFTMTTQINQGGAVCQINGNQILFQMVNPPDNKPRTCTVTMFGGRSLATGWQFEDYNASVINGQANPYGLTGQLPFQIQLQIPPFGDKTTVQISSIDLIGPNGQNWQAALQ